MWTNNSVVHTKKSRFSTRFFELYLKVFDFSTENSVAYYDYYFLIPYVYYLGGYKSAQSYVDSITYSADVKNDARGVVFMSVSKRVSRRTT